MIKREDVKKLVYLPFNNNNLGDINNEMWLVSIVWKDKMGLISHTFSYFYDRYLAENWLSIMTNDGRPYYAYCCDRNYWNNVDELLKGEYNSAMLIKESECVK